MPTNSRRLLLLLPFPLPLLPLGLLILLPLLPPVPPPVRVDTGRGRPSDCDMAAAVAVTDTDTAVPPRPEDEAVAAVVRNEPQLLSRFNTATIDSAATLLPPPPPPPTTIPTHNSNKKRERRINTRTTTTHLTHSFSLSLSLFVVYEDFFLLSCLSVHLSLSPPLSPPERIENSSSFLVLLWFLWSVSLCCWILSKSLSGRAKEKRIDGRGVVE